jgi:ferredoxin-type protein NapF
MRSPAAFLRRSIQALSVMFLFYLIFRTAFPLELTLPAELYLRLDPFIAIIVLMAKKEVIIKMLAAFAMLFAVLLFGNFFCGWLCPMGAVIDLSDGIIRKLRLPTLKSGDNQLKMVRYGILIFAIAASMMTWQILSILDPISLITRTMVILFYPGLVLFFNKIQPVIQTALPGSSLFSSSLPPASFKSNLPVLVTFVTILSLGILRQRFWCRYICPLGALFSIFGRHGILKRHVEKSCNRCTKCARRCPMAAIPNESPETHHQYRCIFCLTCIECPQKAVTFAIGPPHASPNPGAVLSRRYILGSCILGLLCGLAVKGRPLRKPSQGAQNRLIRPPGALAERNFTSICTGCGECFKVCPNNALQPAFLEAGLAGLYTPRLVPRQGYCEEFCNFCGKVCPTGAIRYLPVEKKRLVRIGLARIDKARCIAWDKEKVCLVCNEQCSYQAITGDEKKRPRIDEEKCTGCGICENKCPVAGESAIIVYSRNGQGHD